jgi:hypothetical protein
LRTSLRAASLGSHVARISPRKWRVDPPPLDGNDTYESAINNIFSVGNVADTGRIYTTFTDITFTGNNPVSFPATLFQRSENTLPGWTLAEQVFICPNGDLFCDNYINPTGIMLASFTFTNGALDTHFVDLSAIVPGNPFSITEVSHIVSDGVNPAHLAGAIWVDPAGSVPVLDRSLVLDCRA